MTNDPLRDRLRASLGDAYALGAELGGGGMSRVFVAEDVRLQRRVVVKVLSPTLAAGVSAGRFEQEIRLAAALQQANIVPLLAAGEADGLPYYVMPYVEGRSLRDRLAEGGALPIGEAVSILRDVARALAYAHERAVVHRDIKPENVLLSGGAAVVTDFGIAKALTASRTSDGMAPALTATGSAIGTPAYMAPEQAAAEATADERVDVYAWGMLAFELLAGRHPFGDRTTPMAMLAAHLTDVPPSVDTLRPEVPPAIASLVAACVAKEPAQRPRTGAALVAALDQAASGALRSGERTGGPGAATRASAAATHPRPRRITLLVGGALVTATMIVGGLLRIGRGTTSDAAVTPGAPGAPAVRRVVVLPFENLGDTTDAFFVEGVTDEIADRLARIPGVSVVARSSARRFAATGTTPEAFAKDVGADYVLTGTVRSDRAGATQARGGSVRISPALFRAGTGERLWGEPTTERIADVFRAQANVAERVATALAVTVGASVRAALQRPESGNADAREAVRVGSALLARRGRANLVAALEQFRRAIALDSNYARAWAGLAETLVISPELVGGSIAEGEAAARRAIALDSLDWAGWGALSRVYSQQERFRSAYQAAQRSVALGPDQPVAQNNLYHTLMELGRFEEAGPAIKRAIALDPLVGIYYARLGWWYAAMGMTDSASAVFARTPQVEPAAAAFVSGLAGAMLHLDAGHRDRARVACAELDEPVARATCERMLVIYGDPTQQAALLRITEDGFDDAQQRRGSYYFATVVSARLGDRDRAFRFITSAYEGNNSLYFAFINHPAVRALSSDPRWASLVGRHRER